MSEVEKYESHINLSRVWKIQPSKNIKGVTWAAAYFEARMEADRYREAIIDHLESGNCLDSTDLVNALGSGRLPPGEN